MLPVQGGGRVQAEHAFKCAMAETQKAPIVVPCGAASPSPSPSSQSLSGGSSPPRSLTLLGSDDDNVDALSVSEFLQFGPRGAQPGLSRRGSLPVPTVTPHSPPRSGPLCRSGAAPATARQDIAAWAASTCRGGGSASGAFRLAPHPPCELMATRAGTAVFPSPFPSPPPDKKDFSSSRGRSASAILKPFPLRRRHRTATNRSEGQQRLVFCDSLDAHQMSVPMTRQRLTASEDTSRSRPAPLPPDHRPRTAGQPAGRLRQQTAQTPQSNGHVPWVVGVGLVDKARRSMVNVAFQKSYTRRPKSSVCRRLGAQLPCPVTRTQSAKDNCKPSMPECASPRDNLRRLCGEQAQHLTDSQWAEIMHVPCDSWSTVHDDAMTDSRSVNTCDSSADYTAHDITSTQPSRPGVISMALVPYQDNCKDIAELERRVCGMSTVFGTGEQITHSVSSDASSYDCEHRCRVPRHTKSAIRALAKCGPVPKRSCSSSDHLVHRGGQSTWEPFWEKCVLCHESVLQDIDQSSVVDTEEATNCNTSAVDKPSGPKQPASFKAVLMGKKMQIPTCALVSKRSNDSVFYISGQPNDPHRLKKSKDFLTRLPDTQRKQFCDNCKSSTTPSTSAEYKCKSSYARTAKHSCPNQQHEDTKHPEHDSAPHHPAPSSADNSESRHSVFLTESLAPSEVISGVRDAQSSRRAESKQFSASCSPTSVHDSGCGRTAFSIASADESCHTNNASTTSEHSHNDQALTTGRPSSRNTDKLETGSRAWLSEDTCGKFRLNELWSIPLLTASKQGSRPKTAIQTERNKTLGKKANSRCKSSYRMPMLTSQCKNVRARKHCQDIPYWHVAESQRHRDDSDALYMSITPQTAQSLQGAILVHGYKKIVPVEDGARRYEEAIHLVEQGSKSYYSSGSSLGSVLNGREAEGAALSLAFGPEKNYLHKLLHRRTYGQPFTSHGSMPTLPEKGYSLVDDSVVRHEHETLLSQKDYSYVDDSVLRPLLHQQRSRSALSAKGYSSVDDSVVGPLLLHGTKPTLSEKNYPCVVRPSVYQPKVVSRVRPLSAIEFRHRETLLHSMNSTTDSSASDCKKARADNLSCLVSNGWDTHSDVTGDSADEELSDYVTRNEAFHQNLTTSEFDEQKTANTTTDFIRVVQHPASAYDTLRSEHVGYGQGNDEQSGKTNTDTGNSGVIAAGKPPEDIEKPRAMVNTTSDKAQITAAGKTTEDGSTPNTVEGKTKNSKVGTVVTKVCKAGSTTSDKARRPKLPTGEQTKTTRLQLKAKWKAKTTATDKEIKHGTAAHKTKTTPKVVTTDKTKDSKSTAADKARRDKAGTGKASDDAPPPPPTVTAPTEAEETTIHYKGMGNSSCREPLFVADSDSGTSVCSSVRDNDDDVTDSDGREDEEEESDDEEERSNETDSLDGSVKTVDPLSAAMMKEYCRQVKKSGGDTSTFTFTQAVSKLNENVYDKFSRIRQSLTRANRL